MQSRLLSMITRYMCFFAVVAAAASRLSGADVLVDFDRVTGSAYAVNTSEADICTDFDFGGRAASQCCRADSDHDGETVEWNGNLPPCSVTLLKFSPFDGAKWIGDGSSRNPAFTKKFTPRGKIASASLAVTGVGYYEAFLNGRKIGGQTLRNRCKRPVCAGCRVAWTV